MEISLEFSEILGAFAADGSMQKEHICFWGNITEDKEYYETTLKKLFLKEFNISIKTHPKKTNSVYGFYICNKEIIQKFIDTGFKPGNKTYSMKIPKPIIKSKNPEIWKAFIRGFFDCDGSLNFSRNYGTCQEILKIHTYPRIQA